MVAALAILMAILAAILTHLSVRSETTAIRRQLFLLALLTFGVGSWLGKSLGGFWPGFYTLVSVYCLATIITPWTVFLVRKHHAR